jgi:hypothetical protein
MHATHLNEHDANQGAQSAGEFLGMTGNCGWYLLGSGGATILMVIFLWGIFGVSLLLCLLVGVVLCALSVAYVFALKNNKPEHYDTDYFEAVLVEAGVMQFRFGPSMHRPGNPFAAGDAEFPADTVAPAREPQRGSTPAMRHRSGAAPAVIDPAPSGGEAKPEPSKPDEPMIPLAVYERLNEQLATTEEILEDALAERGEF